MTFLALIFTIASAAALQHAPPVDQPASSVVIPSTPAQNPDMPHLAKNQTPAPSEDELDINKTLSKGDPGRDSRKAMCAGFFTCSGSQIGCEYTPDSPQAGCETRPNGNCDDCNP